MSLWRRDKCSFLLQKGKKCHVVPHLLKWEIYLWSKKGWCWLSAPNQEMVWTCFCLLQHPVPPWPSLIFRIEGWSCSWFSGLPWPTFEPLEPTPPCLENGQREAICRWVRESPMFLICKMGTCMSAHIFIIHKRELIVIINNNSFWGTWVV